MTNEEREMLEHNRDYYRHASPKYAAALDAALRELDAADAMRAELPGLIRELSVGALWWNSTRDAWRRLCELVPGLEGDRPPR